MIREADVDGDGQINYEGMSRCLCVFVSGFLIHFLSISSFIEFVKVCVPVPCLIDRSLLAYSLDDAVEVRNVSMQFSLGFRRVYVSIFRRLCIQITNIPVQFSFIYARSECRLHPQALRALGGGLHLP